MTDKKIKKAISLRSTNYENKFSKVVKPIEIWVMNALKCEKENDKVFHCNDITQIINEICGISRRSFLNEKRTCYSWRPTTLFKMRLRNRCIPTSFINFISPQCC